MVSPAFEPLDAAAPGALSDPVLRAWIAVQIELALQPAAAVEALRASGDPRDALRRLRPDARPDPARVDRALRALAGVGARLLPYPSPAYPWRLSQLRDPAPVLSVIGDCAALRAPAVAIVGARAATVYGHAVAQRLAADLARAGLVIVSGLAHGIDAAAHEGALAAGGRTVAVQACGPDRVYPARHRALAARIAQQGALVSELPPGAPPRRAHFPLRNRLISGLCRALVVVEARERSGSLITVRHALDQGIDVFAVPGPITAATSAGPNRLLRDGAQPVLEAGDILDALGFDNPGTGDGARAPLPPRLQRIVQALQRAPAAEDELARALGCGSDALAPDLLELELEGRVRRDRDGRLRVVS
ncbi:MAG TPA: DNA-processing protein DprA [Myxococcota bacterium]